MEHQQASNNLTIRADLRDQIRVERLNRDSETHVHYTVSRVIGIVDFAATGSYDAEEAVRRIREVLAHYHDWHLADEEERERIGVQAANAVLERRAAVEDGRTA